MAEYGKLLAEIVTDTAKAQNTDALGSDFQATRENGFLRITVAIQSAVKLRLVPSAGSGFYLNNGDALVADSVLVQDVPLDVGRTWNIQTDDAAGCTFSILRVQEISEQ